MNSYLLFFIAMIPIVCLMVALGVFKISAHKACPAVLVITFVLAMLFGK